MPGYDRALLFHFVTGQLTFDKDVAKLRRLLHHANPRRKPVVIRELRLFAARLHHQKVGMDADRLKLSRCKLERFGAAG
jgi:hypothetical protein